MRRPFVTPQWVERRANRACSTVAEKL